ncbi:hypothetical protein RMSM_07150 [Rhodopirellula maiorica SM1]|uniref:Uncharacterized protein n=1 Tax=Rhodopirellula maiorica SM1 TaxID=1265738 RepID=M5R972_9BACT|nr:hypothetical protein [Rhodopirellula maiorica]EMI15920.1 hypothetical protein RMSM_07150 [Rhodopirellula maiorica SM1]
MIDHDIRLSPQRMLRLLLATHDTERRRQEISRFGSQSGDLVAGGSPAHQVTARSDRFTDTPRNNHLHA